jgi:hypothetical protein
MAVSWRAESSISKDSVNPISNQWRFPFAVADYQRVGVP